MDGLKGVIPKSCSENSKEIENLFGEKQKIITRCDGCLKTKIKKHNGTYCLIMDWKKNKAIRYINLIK